MKDFCHLESNDRALINHVLSLHLKTTLLHYRLLLFYRLCLARCIISIAIKHFKFSRPVSRVCLKNKNNNNQVTTNFDERKTSTNRSPLSHPPGPRDQLHMVRASAWGCWDSARARRWAASFLQLCRSVLQRAAFSGSRPCLRFPANQI